MEFEILGIITGKFLKKWVVLKVGQLGGGAVLIVGGWVCDESDVRWIFLIFADYLRYLMKS